MRPRLQSQFREPPQDAFKGDLSFNPRQRSTKTEVCGPAESQMPVVLACNVKAVRIWEALRITVGGGQAALGVREAGVRPADRDAAVDLVDQVEHVEAGGVAANPALLAVLGVVRL